METEANNNTTKPEINGAANGYVNGVKDKISQMRPTLEIEMYDAPPGTEKQHLIKLEDLEHYFKAGEQSAGGFKEQYQMLKVNQQKPWDVGNKTENKAKNRYADLLPYDENRVVLQKLKNDPDSDYINASYIDGYNRKKAYICTQGPLEKTISDLWRMIWQENVSVIAMTANVIENGKKKCEKYWPDLSTKYGDITVSAQKEDVFLDFTVRTFKLQKAGTSTPRFLRQYQFTAWPDHGVPAYPLSLINMLQDIKKYQGNNRNPIVLHCSAGIGRSGTVMLLDIALEMSLTEGKVDFLAILDKLRQQRVNLVETVEQFTFVHRALIEYHFSDVTKKPSPELVLYFNKLRQVNQQTKKSGLDLQFERLRNLDPPGFKEKCATALTDANKSKNRNPQIVPPDDGRPILKTNPPSNYINAVHVHGFGKQNTYVATQFPLPNTVVDFWQLLHDLESTSVVVLNDIRGKDESCPVFWPKSGSVYHGTFKIEHLSSDPEYFNGVLTTKLKIRNTAATSKNRSVKMFHLHGWHKDDFVPPLVDFMFNLLYKAQKWNQKSGQKPIIVTCFDGSRACGFLCALSFILRQASETQYIDVFEAVRTIRVNRPSFVPCVEQYRWLYEAACFLVSNKKAVK